MRNHKKQTITFDQTCYAEKVIKWFGQENCKLISVPLHIRYNPRSNPDKEANTTLWSQYQGALYSVLSLIHYGSLHCYSDLGDKNGFIAYSDIDWGGHIDLHKIIIVWDHEDISEIWFHSN